MGAGLEALEKTVAAEHHGVARNLYLPQIDALRAIAAIAVFLFHLYTSVYPKAELRPLLMLADLRSHGGFWRWLAAPSLFGYAGVPLFFVISGFCIHHSFLHARQPFSYMRFMSRRFWRIYPAYVFAILLSLLLPGNPIWKTHHLRKSLLLHLLFLHNFNNTTIFELSGPFWTLALEFQFYAAYPLLLMLRRWLGMRYAAISSLCLCATVSLALHRGWLGQLTLPWMPIIFWVQWCLGALIAEQFADGKASLINLPFAFLLCTIGVLFAVPIAAYSEWNYLAWAVLFAAITERWIRKPQKTQEANTMQSTSWPFELLVWLGTISYSTYLLHAMVLGQLLHRLPGSTGSRFALAMISIFPLVILASAASYYLIERPGIAMGRKCVGWCFPARPLGNQSC